MYPSFLGQALLRQQTSIGRPSDDHACCPDQLPNKSWPLPSNTCDVPQRPLRAQNRNPRGIKTMNPSRHPGDAGVMAVHQPCTATGLTSFPALKDGACRALGHRVIDKDHQVHALGLGRLLQLMGVPDNLERPWLPLPRYAPGRPEGREIPPVMTRNLSCIWLAFSLGWECGQRLMSGASQPTTSLDLSRICVRVSGTSEAFWRQ